MENTFLSAYNRLRTKDVGRNTRSSSKFPRWVWTVSSLILIRLKCPRISLLKNYVLMMKILMSLLYMCLLSRYVWGLICLLWPAVSEFPTRQWKWSQASEWTRAHISQVIWRSVGCECQWWQQETSDQRKIESTLCNSFIYSFNCNYLVHRVVIYVSQVCAFQFFNPSSFATCRELTQVE